MKVVALRNMLIYEHAVSLEYTCAPFVGREFCIERGNMLYMPVNVAKELGYSILDEWIEEI